MAKRFFIENITENKQGISPSLSLKLSSYSKKEGTYFLVELPTYIWVGKFFSATITAKNVDGTINKQYKGDCTITENGDGSITPIAIASTEWENGIVTKSLIYLTSDTSESTLIITVTDDIKPWIMGSGKTKLTNIPYGKAKIVFDNELYYDDEINIVVVNKDWIKRKIIPKGTTGQIGGFVDYNGVLYYSTDYETGKGSLYKLINDEPIEVISADSNIVPASIIILDNNIWLAKMVDEGEAGKHFYLLKYRPGNENWINTETMGEMPLQQHWVIFNNEIYCPFFLYYEGKLCRIDTNGNVAIDFQSNINEIISLYNFENNLYCITHTVDIHHRDTYYLHKRIGANNWLLIKTWGYQSIDILYKVSIIYKNKLWAMGYPKNHPENDVLVYSTDGGVNFTEYMKKIVNISDDPLIARGILANAVLREDMIDFNDSLVTSIAIIPDNIITIYPIIEGEP